MSEYYCCISDRVCKQLEGKDDRINELEGMLENTQDDNVEKERRIEELKIEREAIALMGERRYGEAEELIVELKQANETLANNNHVLEVGFQELKDELEKHRWIPVEDEPECIGDYLVAVGDEYIQQCYWDDFTWREWKGGEIVDFSPLKATHYKPVALPESEG